MGLLIGSFTVIPILIIFRFAIPTTKKLEMSDYLTKNNPITRRHLASVLVLSIILVIITFITYFLSRNGFVGMSAGIIWALIMGLGKIGKNSANISDYIESSKQYFTKSLEETLLSIENQ